MTAPAPGTATREDAAMFVALVGDYEAKAYAEGAAEALRRPEEDSYRIVKMRAAVDAARASLLEHERLLRVRLDHALERAIKADVALTAQRQATEEATARVRALEKVLREIAAYNYDPGSTTSGEIARAALGVPTSAADGGAR